MGAEESDLGINYELSLSNRLLLALSLITFRLTYPRWREQSYFTFSIPFPHCLFVCLLGMEFRTSAAEQNGNERRALREVI